MLQSQACSDTCSRAITIAVQETKRHQRIEEVISASRMQSKRGSELRRRHRTVAKRREQIEFHRGEQDLRGPKTRRSLHDGCGIELLIH
jgi:hypothetical protein